MTIKTTLQEDLKKAMISKDTVALNTIRAIKTAIMKYETSGQGEADESKVMDIIAKEAKQRQDSIAQFEQGGRDDLAANEKAELAILQKYLPEQMAEEEIARIVKEVIAQTGASSTQDLGKVMGALMPRIKGKADGALVNKIVRENLN